MNAWRTQADKYTKDSNCILLPPKRRLEIDNWLHKKLAATLVTRYSPDNPQMKILMATTSKYVPTSVHQWGQAQICDGGDRFKCCALLKGKRHICDCTYVKVSASQLFPYRIPLVRNDCPVYAFFFIFPVVSLFNPHSFIMTSYVLIYPYFSSLTARSYVQYSAR